MIKRKGQLIKKSCGTPLYKRDPAELELQEFRKEKLAAFVKRHGHVINLSSFKPNTPCPVCGTICEELKNNNIHAYFDARVKRGEEHPWTCWICIQRIIDPPAGCQPPKPKRPRGWQFMAVFVDKDGTVFHKGIEQPELKGTLEPTVIEEKPTEPKETERKLSRAEKDQLRHDALMELNKIKGAIKKGIDEKGKKLTKGKTKELEKALRKQEKFINKL